MATALAVVVEVCEDDIPGASLKEPLEAHGMPALRWWLQCRGMKVASSMKKNQLITRIREAIKDGAKVIDVDGSFLYRKHQRMKLQGDNVAPLDIPPRPFSGWESVSERNYSAISSKIPIITQGTVYTYLAEGVGRKLTEQGGTFRALARGYTHWASGRMEQLEINTKHPEFCHIKCCMKPSMKTGIYHVYIRLGHDGDIGCVCAATCECAAGESASALVALTPSYIAPSSSSLPSEMGIEEEVLPVTSYPCQWKVPRKRKESKIKMAEAVFEKHTYGKERKRLYVPLEEFDPRPEAYRGKTNDYLPVLLDKVRGKGICVSLLFDPSTCYWDTTTLRTSSAELPTKEKLQENIVYFKQSLHLTPKQIREFECATREQRRSPAWYSAGRYRLTASTFGEILHRRTDTRPDNLVQRILHPKTFQSVQTDWGITQEPVATQEYIRFQHSAGYSDLTVTPSGFIVSKEYPFLGASPDGDVYCPSSPEPHGFLEVKCSYSQRNMTPAEACMTSAFCCELEDGNPTVIKLRRTHRYYAQVQGQMACGERKWCDFVVYTTKGVAIERIPFDYGYWSNNLLPKLTSFYDNILAPEIISPVHHLGLYTHEESFQNVIFCFM